MTKPDGGTAFPGKRSILNIEIDEEGNKIDSYQIASQGMTLRDWFAGMAMQALHISDSLLHWKSPGNKSMDDIMKDDNHFVTNKIKSCYAIADAMLKEREK